jgi:LPXTG-motif cell wall-anchored protein
MQTLTRMPALFSCLVLVAAAGLPAARADQFDRKTTMTISEPIQIPNRVLEPGTYVFKLVDWKKSDKHIVQIFTPDEKHVVTTIIAIPNYRLQPKNKTEFTFWETPAGQPPALRAWFYPGDNFGQEFAYPKEMSAQISTGNSNVQVPVETSAVTTSEVPPPPHVSERAPAPAPAPPEPVQSAAVAQQPAPAPEKIIEPSDTISHATPTELPHTASQEPFMLLAGLISLVAFAVLTVKTRRTQ